MQNWDALHFLEAALKYSADTCIKGANQAFLLDSLPCVCVCVQTNTRERESKRESVCVCVSVLIFDSLGHVPTLAVSGLREAGLQENEPDSWQGPCFRLSCRW